MPQVEQRAAAGPSTIAGRRRVAIVIGVVIIGFLVITSLGLLVRNTSTTFPSRTFKPSISTFASTVSHPTYIAGGSNGSLWFTGRHTEGIGTITPSGSATRFNLPNVSTHSVASGRDGNIWFIANDSKTLASQIGRITPKGETTYWPLPRVSLPGDITSGSDGNLWFTDAAQRYGPDPRAKGVPEHKIGRITTEGVITEFALPTPDGDPHGITAGPDGAVWFTESNRIGRIDPAGSIRELALPPGSNPGEITLGPDGALWFTSRSERDAKIGRITSTGSVTRFALPQCEQVCNRSLRGIAGGPDGNVWFTESKGYGEGNVWRIASNGSLTSFAVNGWATGITSGVDGNIWFTEELEDTIGRVNIKTR
jgi:streptogramin lyase